MAEFEWRQYSKTAVMPLVDAFDGRCPNGTPRDRPCLLRGPNVMFALQGGNGELSQLASLLIGRACDNEEVANFLFWYLKLEAEVRYMYHFFHNGFLHVMRVFI